MRSRRLAALGVAAALALQAAPGSVHSAESADPTIGLLRLQGDLDAASEPGRYGWVILNSWEADRIPALKTANPDVKVLVYKDMAATVDYATHDGRDNEHLPAGVGYHEALEHPEWFLTDTSGRRVEFCSYPGAWWMDVGNPDYQRRWLDNVAADLAAGGWDGVMIDDAMASPWAHLCGRRLAAYPNDASYAAATESFLAAVGPELMRRGYLVLPNVSDADLPTWTRWLSYTSGAVREWWTKSGTEPGAGYYTDHHWSFQMAQMEAAEDAGKAFIGITYSSPDDERAMTYARASFLLAHDGGPSALIYHPGRGTDPFSPFWTESIGEPLEDRRQVGGAWVRRFTGGLVAVNPSSSQSVDLALAEPLLDVDGRTLSTLSLPPAGAAILRSPQGPPPEVTPGSPLTLRKRRPARRVVELRYRGARTDVVIVRRNGRRVSVDRNDGIFRQRLRVARSTRVVRYRVCELDRRPCSNRVRVRAPRR